MQWSFWTSPIFTIWFLTPRRPHDSLLTGPIESNRRATSQQLDVHWTAAMRRRVEVVVVVVVVGRAAMRDDHVRRAMLSSVVCSLDRPRRSSATRVCLLGVFGDACRPSCARLPACPPAPALVVGFSGRIKTRARSKLPNDNNICRRLIRSRHTSHMVIAARR